MFISINRMTAYGSRTSVYECDRYHIHPVEGEPTEFTITMEDRSSRAVAATYNTEEPGLGIFAMNNEGRTIDTIFRSE